MTVETIKEMRHAIGLDYKAPKRGKYEAYRNYAMYGAPHETWEALVADGLAICRVETKSTWLPQASYWYSLTRAGLDLMEAMIGVKITESRDPE